MVSIIIFFIICVIIWILGNRGIFIPRISNVLPFLLILNILIASIVVTCVDIFKEKYFYLLIFLLGFLIIHFVNVLILKFIIYEQNFKKWLTFDKKGCKGFIPENIPEEVKLNKDKFEKHDHFMKFVSLFLFSSVALTPILYKEFDDPFKYIGLIIPLVITDYTINLSSIINKNDWEKKTSEEVKQQEESNKKADLN